MNPAYTGMFHGALRAAASYENTWQTITVPYVTAAVGVDMPIAVGGNGNYLACGVQTVKSQAGDGNRNNFEATASLAYHMQLGTQDKKHKQELGLGLQAGYASNSVNIAYVNSTLFTNGQSQQYHLGIGNSVNYYMINAGISYSQSVGDKFSYNVGLAGYNLNQPSDQTERNLHEAVGLARIYVATAGASWVASRRITLQPALLYTNAGGNYTYTGGADVLYSFGTETRKTRVRNMFIGGWVRSLESAGIAAGTTIGAFRLAAGAGRDIRPRAIATGYSSLLFQCSYIAPARTAKKAARAVPCDRF